MGGHTPVTRERIIYQVRCEALAIDLTRISHYRPPVVLAFSMKRKSVGVTIIQIPALTGIFARMVIIAAMAFVREQHIHATMGILIRMIDAMALPPFRRLTTLLPMTAASDPVAVRSLSVQD
jgi:hypothetical protein